MDNGARIAYRRFIVTAGDGSQRRAVDAEIDRDLGGPEQRREHRGEVNNNVPRKT